MMDVVENKCIFWCIYVHVHCAYSPNLIRSSGICHFEIIRSTTWWNNALVHPLAVLQMQQHPVEIELWDHFLPLWPIGLCFCGLEEGSGGHWEGPKFWGAGCVEEGCHGASEETTGLGGGQCVRCNYKKLNCQFCEYIKKYSFISRPLHHLTFD